MYQLRCLILLFGIYYVSEGVKAEGSYEAVITDARRCDDPHPPFAKRPHVLTNYSITVVNGKRYLSGRTRIYANTPMLNFSGRTYEVDSAGNKVVRFQITGVSCRNFVLKSILMFTKLSVEVDPKTCVMSKGVYPWHHVDLDKVAHSSLTWHAPGNVVHQLQLVHKGVTLLCDEIYATNKLL